MSLMFIDLPLEPITPLTLGGNVSLFTFKTAIYAHKAYEQNIDKPQTIHYRPQARGVYRVGAMGQLSPPLGTGKIR